MRITTENTFNITEQPKEFCPLIDETIEKLKEVQEESFVNIDTLKDNLEEEDQILNLSFVTVPNAFLLKIENDAQQLLKWSKEWLELFQQSMEKETDKNISNQLIDFNLDAQEVVEKFEKDFLASYKILESAHNFLETSEHHHNSTVDSYQYVCDDHLRVNHEIVDFVNEKYDFLESNHKDIEKEVEQCIKGLEGIRGAVSDLRVFTNEKIKNHTKVQLTRIQDENWILYMNWNMGENEKNRYQELVKDSEKLGLRII